MQVIAEFQPNDGLREMMLAAAEKGTDEIARVFRAFKADSRHKYVQTEADMNRFGYLMLRQKKINEAIAIFTLNVETNPTSANVYDSLGDAYDAAGRKDDAIKAYEKALSIDPNLQSSREGLKKLKGN